jgi:hypothetical protein
MSSGPVWQERRHAPTEPENLKFPNEAISRACGGGSREAVVDAVQRLFLELRVAAQLETAFPPGIETQDNAEARAPGRFDCPVSVP